MRLAREGVAQVLGGAEHRAAERVVAEHGLVDEVLGQRSAGWSSARAISWITTPRSRSSSSASSCGRATKSVSRSVASRRALGPGGDVEGDEIVAGVGVEHGADPLGGLVDVAVGRVLLAALEHEVLEEVGHPVLLGPLGARAGVEGDEDRHRPRAGDRDAVQRQAVVERRSP